MAKKERNPSREEPLRVVVENVRPCVDGGRFAAKTSLGEIFLVQADVFVDGHDSLLVRLLHRRQGTSEWTVLPMTPKGNDLWTASLRFQELGFHEYSVVAWVDRFETWRRELKKKFDAAQDVASELLEGAALVREAAEKAPAPARARLLAAAGVVGGSSPAAARVVAALDAALVEDVYQFAERRGSVALEAPRRVWVDRERARFGAWYEMFPRSTGSDPSRSATFREAEERLPEIARMGFDVVYLPPIHPIGKSHRKGPNNTLVAKPGDPGSPWAIGAKEGGHTAVEPGLGTLADFAKFVAAAREESLEIALDIAFQCSPDHPWVKEHPGWFRQRPDGSIKYAENPPKKYQDIYPFEFECEDWRGLWEALRDVVLFWAERGVKIFRIDNPHTKPFRFWDWLIAEVQASHPEAIFLSEAFTRPKVMKRLAKGGFTQSYTYFTWRNAKPELEEYLTELTATDVYDYMRPNFFANTPDIFHEYLQFGGRAAYQVRLVLAGLLSATYGIYGPPFELCETRAVPGTEEYLDSEKYQVRAWDLDRPGNIRDFVARVNEIRRRNPALHFNHRLRFHEIDNPKLLAFSKTSPDLANVIVVVANLDPHNVQSGWLELPLEDLEIAEGVTYQMHDLLGDERFLWQGPRNFVSLDPRTCPAHVFAVRRRTRTERDFDYFI